MDIIVAFIIYKKMSCSQNKQLKLRKYQQDIVNAIAYDNVIVKMPTGSGKTFVAAEFIKRGQYCRERNPDAKRRAVLFLVPACDLVTQQKKALKAWIKDFEITEYMGGMSSPSQRFDVLVSTPQAFLVSKEMTNEIDHQCLLTAKELLYYLLSKDFASK